MGRCREWTDDERRPSLCGVRGTSGCYDLETGELERYSQPYELESNFREVAVHGEAGDERVHVADDDGRIARLTADDGIQVREVAVPGPNEPITAAFDVGEMLFATDTTGRLSVIRRLALAEPATGCWRRSRAGCRRRRPAHSDA